MQKLETLRSLEVYLMMIFRTLTMLYQVKKAPSVKLDETVITNGELEMAAHSHAC